jgi:hypothetical protein
LFSMNPNILELLSVAGMRNVLEYVAFAFKSFISVNEYCNDIVSFKYKSIT